MNTCSITPDGASHESMLSHLVNFFFRLGGWGLVGLGLLDSSFLFLPLGNDLLILALTARYPGRWVLFAVLAALGSLLGSAITSELSRKGGEKGLEGRVSPRRLAYLKGKVEQRAGLVLGFSALMPPPFPFTLVVAVTSALQYPRQRLYPIIGCARLVRFSAEALLARKYGTQVLAWTKTPIFEWTVGAIAIVCLGSSAWALWKWFRKKRA